MADIQRYLNLVTSEHRTKPKFNAWLAAGLEKVDGATTVLKGMDADFDIDNAIGAQLDTAGVIVGVDRVLTFQPSDGSSPYLDDDTYRLIARAKIAQNQWNGTIQGLYDLWNNIFPDLFISILDIQDMSMNVLVIGATTTLQQELVINGYIIPKPMGVSINYSFSNAPIFSYDLYNDAFKGYDEGHWIAII